MDRVFEQLALKTKPTVQDLSWESGRFSNDISPFRAYATFRSGSKVVDLSVDCKLSEGLLLISADLAREEGFVLSDMPVRELPIKSNPAGISSEIEDAIVQVENFALEQVHLLTQEFRQAQQ